MYILAISTKGLENCLEYSRKLEISPTLILPAAARIPLITATMTKLRLLITLVSGMRKPDQIWAFVATWHNWSLLSSNCRIISFSLPKAFTIFRPEMLSSTCPLSFPSICCWEANSFLVCFVMVRVRRKISHTDRKAMQVRPGLKYIIMHNTPRMVKP